MREIEIKVQIERSETLLVFLKKHAVMDAPSHQKDEYFNLKHRDFLGQLPKVTEWLRLRTEDSRCTINYKYWHYDSAGKSTYCDENETAVGSAEELATILRAMGATP